MDSFWVLIFIGVIIWFAFKLRRTNQRIRQLESRIADLRMELQPGETPRTPAPEPSVSGEKGGAEAPREPRAPASWRRRRGSNPRRKLSPPVSLQPCLSLL